MKYRDIDIPSIRDGYLISSTGVVLGLRGKPMKPALANGDSLAIPLETAEGSRTARTIFSLLWEIWGLDYAEKYQRKRDKMIAQYVCIRCGKMQSRAKMEKDIHFPGFIEEENCCNCGAVLFEEGEIKSHNCTEVKE